MQRITLSTCFKRISAYDIFTMIVSESTMERAHFLILNSFHCVWQVICSSGEHDHGAFDKYQN